MRYFTSLFFCCCLLSTGLLSAQQIKVFPPPSNTHTQIEDLETLQRKNAQPLPPAQPSVFDEMHFEVTPLPSLTKPVKGQMQLAIQKDPNNKLPIWIEGTPDGLASGSRAPETVSHQYLNSVKELIQIDDPENEFIITKTNMDNQDRQHIRLQQRYQGLPVYGGDIVLHEADGLVYLFNGRYFPTPTLDNLTPQTDEVAAQEIVKADVEQHTAFKDLNDFERQLQPLPQLEAELLIYHPDENPDIPLLTWHITARPNLVSRWEYFVDATNGNILHQYNNICQIHGGRCAEHPHGSHPTDISRLEGATPQFAKARNPQQTVYEMPPPGPETANAVDLKGITRLIHVYEQGGTYYMIDASRDMFSSGLSNIPDEPVGAVWTINGNNNSPQNNSFQASHITSSNNNWNNATAVSAHFNGGVAFEYFKQTFGRNSINGQGGNIVSLINITESNGDDMDNAFWNGQAIWYGNGNQAFNHPLPKADDVAGHEMAHGVIQSTANLQYQNESGALNESFADIFGAMIDRNDWKIGEEVSNPSVFPSGTMRDMQNPHNGGSSLNDFYYQPAHYNERYTGTADNGGVHINSGIPNYAYYLFASNSVVGKDKAEQVFYKALDDYLVASSQFVDLRNAVLQAATDLYGSAVSNAAADAFSQVGIGQGSGTNNQTDTGTNPGDEFVLWSDTNLSNIENATTAGAASGTFSSNDHISRPSVSDNGQYIEYVGSDNNIWEIVVDWQSGNVTDEYILSNAGNWRNVAISKDGNRIAAVTTDYDNRIFVYDFGLDAWEEFELYNPTYSQGVTTGDVDFADILEFDISGEYLMYDAQNTINGDFGDDITYWDIGFLRVWNNQTDNFSSGTIQKLFTGLPENVSIGNPTFAKNSPYIIAFDFIEGTTSGTEYAVLGVNLETYDQGLIWENAKLGFPSYATDDDRIIFSGNDTQGNAVVGLTDLNPDKINGSGTANVLISDAEWGVWFATGDRELVATHEVGNIDGELLISPNPFREILQMDYASPEQVEASIAVFDLMGRQLYRTEASLQQGNNRLLLPLSHLTTGTYLVQLQTATGMLTTKVVKE